MSKVAFLGLGVMGAPMAGHLSTKGHQVSVYNRTAANAKAWCGKYSGQAFETPREAAEGQEFIMICVGNDDNLRSVVLGENGALSGAAEGAVIVDHSTVSAEVSEQLAEASAAKGVGYLDAPISGGQSGAEGGVLTIMVGGREADFAAAEPIMMAYGRACRLMGPCGAGQKTKMVNQIAITGAVQGLAEAVHFAQKAGLDVESVLDVVGKGAAGSWQMENRGSTMSRDEFDFGFAVDWMRKDLGICLSEARKNGATLPLTALADQFYADVQAMGGGRWDSSSLIKRLNSK